MDDMEPPRQPSQHLDTPLIISMIGIISTALAILLYNFIMTRYCARRLRVALSRRIQEGEKRVGVEEDVLETIPVLAYTLEDGGLFRVDQTECAVCLGEFDEGEVVRLLPSCRHAFHVDCIDQWFFSHSNCPVCRTPVVAPCLSSELSMSLESAVVENGGANEDVAATSTDSLARAQTGSNRALRHCASVAYNRERKLSLLPGVLKRSLSLDFSFVSNKIQRARERSSSCSSSSSSMLSAIILTSKSCRRGSSIRLDRVSSMVTNSFSKLRTNQSDVGIRTLPL